MDNGLDVETVAKLRQTELEGASPKDLEDYIFHSTRMTGVTRLMPLVRLMADMYEKLRPKPVVAAMGERPKGFFGRKPAPEAEPTRGEDANE